MKFEVFVSGKKIEPRNLSNELMSRMFEIVILKLQERIEADLKSKLQPEEMEKVTVKIKADSIDSIKATLSGPDEIIEKIK